LVSNKILVPVTYFEMHPSPPPKKRWMDKVKPSLENANNCRMYMGVCWHSLSTSISTLIYAWNFNNKMGDVNIKVELWIIVQYSVFCSLTHCVHITASYLSNEKLAINLFPLNVKGFLIFFSCKREVSWWYIFQKLQKNVEKLKCHYLKKSLLIILKYFYN
jgi:hypothetical protein